MRRRKNHHLRKPDQAGRARWYAVRGYPYSFIAEKLGVHRNSVRAWCAGIESDRSIDRLVVRLRSLPPAQRREVTTRVARKKAA